MRCMDKNLPNTPLLAAAVKVSAIMRDEDFFDNMRASFAHKFSSKPEVIEGNMRAIQCAWEEVRKI
jgi:pyruvate ferredoxin oxidoreductase gamma subunit